MLFFYIFNSSFKPPVSIETLYKSKGIQQKFTSRDSFGFEQPGRQSASAVKSVSIGVDSWFHFYLLSLASLAAFAFISGSIIGVNQRNPWFVNSKYACVHEFLYSYIPTYLNSYYPYILS